MIASNSVIRFGRRALLVAAAMLCFVGCDEDMKPEDSNGLPDQLPLPELTSPENVMAALQRIYNDKEHPASERLAAYASLLDSAFVFHLQQADIAAGLPESWELEDELLAHHNMFEAEHAGDIYSLELNITHNPAQVLTPPEIGRDGWQEVFATNIYLRIMFNLEDGLEVNGAQGEFKFPPPEDGHFKLGDWTDLPRPGSQGRSAVQPTTWGGIKASFNRP